MNQQEKDLVIRDLQRELNEAKSAPQPLEATPWLHFHASEKLRCECGKDPSMRIQPTKWGCVLHYKCPDCGQERRVSYQSPIPPPAPNAVHERLEEYCWRRVDENSKTFLWRTCGTKTTYFPCPCDACAKARGE